MLPIRYNYTELLKQHIDLIKQNNTLLYSLAVIVPGGFLALGYMLFSNQQRIIREAKKYIGQEEIAGNRGFIDKEFEALMMQSGGYNAGEQWCMRFASLIWNLKLGSKNKYQESLDYNLTGSTQTSYKRFSEDDTGLYEVSQIPSKGAIVIWQSYRNGQANGWKGHAGIVQRVTSDGFETIEGNVNNYGEGLTSSGIVAEKQYSYEKEINRLNGNRLKGFIKLK